MAGDIINLRKARKAKARAGKAATAAENRTRFGRTKADRLLQQARDDLATRRFNELQRDTTREPGKPSDRDGEI